MVSEVSQCGEQPKQKKTGSISNHGPINKSKDLGPCSKQTAIVHIVISVMYFVDTVIPIADTFPCKDITVVLALNTLVALLTGIVGVRASKRPSIPLSKVYIGLSVLCGVGAMCLLVVAILRFFISCGPPDTLISTVITMYSTVSAFFEIPNCIVSMSVFHKVVNKLKQERATENADEFKLKEKGQPSTSKYEYSTIDDDLSFNNPKNTDGHPYQETLQGALEDNENGYDSHHFYPTVIVTSQQSQQIAPEYEPYETTYIEMDDKMTSNAGCSGQVTKFVYDYTYADVAPEPPPRTKRSSEVPKSVTLPNSYLELYNKSDPPKEYAQSAELEHARERRQTYFHKKFASRFQPLADDQPTSRVFLGKVNKYHNAFADRLRCAVSNEQICLYQVANQSPLEDKSENKVGEPFPRPRSTDQDQHLHSVDGQSCLYDVKITRECTSSNIEPVQKNAGLYGDGDVNGGGIVKLLQQNASEEYQLSSQQGSVVCDEMIEQTGLKSQNTSDDDVDCLVVNESYSYLHAC